ncbi:MAG: DNA-binding response regulator [Epsilonproteobacteria bacterium]|nr:MAG: DNA-binding response regulator [Campylobacterota bacterium]
MNKTKILIVEDEPIVALELKTEVEKLNIEVTGMVHTQKKVLLSIEKNEPDIILMDVKLGKGNDGINIAKEIQKTKNIPILYVTAFSDDNTMERAFSTNPLGYIVKPFKKEDLKTNIQLAQYKITLNTVSNINDDYTCLGEEFYFDTKNSHLYYQENFVKLGAKEKHLLSILVEANHAKVLFSDLEDAIWDGNKPSASALRTLVYRLKGKLGNNIIDVTYGYGYNIKPLH